MRVVRPQGKDKGDCWGQWGGLNFVLFNDTRSL